MLKPLWHKHASFVLVILGLAAFILYLAPLYTHAQTAAVPLVNPILTGSNSAIFQFLNDFVVGVIGSLAAFAGLIFDWFIYNFIIEFGRHYQETSFGAVIDSTWSTVRDIFNLTFIFGLVYIGFQIILGINDSQAKRTIGWLILAALLVNFSLFITKFVVDFSNIAAVEIYNLFESVNGSGLGGATGNQIEVSISQAFINSLGMSSLFDALPGGAQLLYIFCLFITFLVLIYVFLAGAILIAIRFGALCLYLVFSPIMFIGWVFPGMAQYSKDYWHKFLGQAFFAPAFLFMLYLSFKVTDAFSDNTLRGTADNLQQLNGISPDNVDTVTSGFLLVFPFFITTIVFLVASMIVAKKMGAAGASGAISVGNSLRKSAQGMAYRNTAGLALAGGVKGFDRLDRAAERGGASGFAARMTRAAIGGESSRKLLEKGANYGAGGLGRDDVKKMNKERKSRATSGNADADAKKKIKKNARIGGTELESAVRGASTALLIDVLQGYKYGDEEYENIVNAMTHEQKKKLLDAKDDEFSATERKNLNSQAVKSVTDKIGSGLTLNSEAVAKLTPKEIDTLGNAWILKNSNLANLTYSQVDKVADSSSVLGESEKSTLKTKWGDAIMALPVSDYAKIMDRTAKDVAALPAQVLTNEAAIPHLTDKVMRAIAESNMTALDRATIKDHMAGATANISGADYLNRPDNNHRITHW